MVNQDIQVMMVGSSPTISFMINMILNWLNNVKILFLDFINYIKKKIVLLFFFIIIIVLIIINVFFSIEILGEIIVGVISSLIVTIFYDFNNYYNYEKERKIKISIAMRKAHDIIIHIDLFKKYYIDKFIGYVEGYKLESFINELNKTLLLLTSFVNDKELAYIDDLIDKGCLLLETKNIIVNFYNKGYEKILLKTILKYNINYDEIYNSNAPMIYNSTRYADEIIKDEKIENEAVRKKILLINEFVAYCFDFDNLLKKFNDYFECNKLPIRCGVRLKNIDGKQIVNTYGIHKK